MRFWWRHACRSIASALVLAADDRLTQVVIEPLRFQACVSVLRDPSAEDLRDLARVADRAVEVEEALVQAVQRRTALEDQVGAVLDLTDEQAIYGGGADARYTIILKGDAIHGPTRRI